MTSRLISLIVTLSRNADPTDLSRLLESVSHQTTAQLEVLVVSDSNHPNTRIPDNSAFPVRFIHSNTLGASRCRNLGAANSIGAYLAFLDDDVVLDSRWCEKLIDTFEDKSIGAASGFALAKLDNAELDWIPAELRWVVGGCYWDYDTITDVYGGAGMNFSVRRDVFFHVGGYNENLGPKGDRPENAKWIRLGAEESELALKIIMKTGQRVVFNPSMTITHRLRRNSMLPLSLLKRAMHVGHNRAYIQSMFSGRLARSSDDLVIMSLFRHAISRKLLPKPMLLWKRGSFTFVVLFGTLLGYFVGSIQFRIAE